MKRIITFILTVILLCSLFSVSAFAASDSTAHTHNYTACELVASPSEGNYGILRFYCSCADYYDVLLEPLPTVYVSQYRNDAAELCSRIIIAQEGIASGKTLTATMAEWNATQAAAKYSEHAVDGHTKHQFVEFKVKDVGIGSFNEKITDYTLTIPVSCITSCVEDGKLALHLTTGAAMIYLPEEATAALVNQAKDSIGVKVTVSDGKPVAQLLVDGKDAAAPAGVEMLYWVKDAGDQETASGSVLNSTQFADFRDGSKFDLMYSDTLE